MIAGVVAHERVVPRGFATVKVHCVRSPVQSGDAVPVLLAVRFARLFGLRTVEPAALIRGVEQAAGNECLYPGREIVGGRDNTSGRCSEGMVQVRIVLGRTLPVWAAAFTWGE